MTDLQRLQQAEELFHAALNLAETERAAFLARRCAGDEALRDEVESLLAAHPAAADFLAEPIARLAAFLPTAAPAEPSASNGPARLPLAFWGGLAVVLTVFGFYLYTCWLVFAHGNRDRFGFQTRFEEGSQRVSVVRDTGPAAGLLQAGDRVVALAGDVRFSRVDPLVRLRLLPEGARYPLTIERGSITQTVELQAATFAWHEAARWRTFITYLLRALVCLAIGFLLVWLKPAERFTHLATAAFLAIAVLALRVVLEPLLPQFSGATRWAVLVFWALTGGHLFVAFAVHASYHFPPEAFQRSQFWEAVKNLFYLCVTLGFARTFVVTALGDGGQQLDWLYQRAALLHSVKTFSDWYYPAGLIALSAVLVRNFIYTRDLVQRRRIQWVIAGTLTASFALTMIELARLTLDALGYRTLTGGAAFNWWNWLADALVLVFPGIWAYAILHRQIYDVSFVLRRGLQYLLARNVLSALLALPALGLFYNLLANSERTVREVIVGSPLFLGLLLLTGLAWFFQQRLQQWIDRRFFREAYDREQMLLALLDEISVEDSAGETARRVCQRIAAALHPQSLRCYFRVEGSPALTLSYATPGAFGLAPPQTDSEFWRWLELHPQMADWPLPHNFPHGEVQWLLQPCARLLLPLCRADGRLNGLLVLGEKRSEQPYSATDRTLLQAIARQLALVGEMSALREQMHQGERAQRAVLARLEAQQFNLLRECVECGVCVDAPHLGATANEMKCAACGGALVMTVPVERTINEHYRLEQRIGQGGMGTVYRATDLHLRRDVALKVLTAAHFGEAAAQHRFTREAWAAARLQHPNIVAVYDHGATAAGGAWLAMELLHGVTLRTELQRVARLPVLLIGEWFAQLVAGVHAAHAAGVIHRDLKPENIMLVAAATGERQVRILDFGLAKLRHAQESRFGAASSLTAAGMLLGTPAYMAPEQLSGASTDERADIFALGVLLVEMLTGQHPFSRTGYRATTDAIQHDGYHLAGGSAAVQRLDATLQKCLAKEPAARYASVAELRDELLPALRACPAEWLELGAQPNVAHGAVAEVGFSFESIWCSFTPYWRALRRWLGWDQSGKPQQANVTPASLTRLPRGRTAQVLAAVVLAVAGVIPVLWWLSWRTMSQPKPPFLANQFRRLTSSSNAFEAALSPDGRLVGYFLKSTGSSLRLKNLATARETTLLSLVSGNVRGLTFSQDGNFIYYSVRQPQDSAFVLYRLPTTGGTPVRILAAVDSAVSFSPDGKQLTFVRDDQTTGESALLVSSADGTAERKLAVCHAPDNFSVDGPAWSPDGQRIAIAKMIPTPDFHFRLLTVSLADGTEQPVGASRWAWLMRVAWLTDGKGLVAVGRHKSNAEKKQIWQVEYPSGELRRISNDLNDYRNLSLAGSKLVTVRTEIRSDVWIVQPDKPDSAVRLTHAPADRNGLGLDWTQDGRIAFTSDAGGHQNLWLMNADGSQARQLTPDSDDQDDFPLLSSAGKHIVFTSLRSGAGHIWRIATDGSALTELTHGANDFKPHYTPDGQWIVYSTQSAQQKRVVVKQSVTDPAATPIPLTDKYSDFPVVSPDGEQVACMYQASTASPRTIALLPVTGGAPARVLKMPEFIWPVLRWHPTGRGLCFLDARDSFMNVWFMSLKDEAVKRLTSFGGERLFRFAWSRDGHWLACARGVESREVILIEVVP